MTPGPVRVMGAGVVLNQCVKEVCMQIISLCAIIRLLCSFNYAQYVTHY